jgi:translation initiation factor IF-3
LINGGIHSTSTKKTRVNRDITSPEILLIGADGEKVGVVKIRQALEQAEEAGLDLVEIAPNGAPPVCRIMDYGKYRFEQSKKLAQQRKKQKQIQIKELKLRPVTDMGDYVVKIRNAIRFLEEGDKVKFTIRFRGRELAYHEQGMEILERIAKDLDAVGVIEQKAKLEGRQFVMVIAPKKKIKSTT